MSCIEWGDAYSVCVEFLDEDHKQLFALLRKADDACKLDTQTENYPLIVNELVSYLLNHFAAEEGYMNKIKYPDIAAHKHEHELFYNRVLAFQQKIYENKEDYTKDMLDLTETLSHWLHHHILNVDQQYTNFVVLSYFK